MSVQDYSPVPGSNTTISGINVGEGCAPANINNAIRQMMADIADGLLQFYVQDKTPAQRTIARDNLGLKGLAIKDKAAIDTDTTGTLPLNRGGTGGTTQAAARSGIGISAVQAVINLLNAAVAHNNAAWLAGTATTGGLPTPKQIADAIGARAYGSGRTWMNVLDIRVPGTSYQNTSLATITVKVRGSHSTSPSLQVSKDGVSWQTVDSLDIPNNGTKTASIDVPPGSYYRLSGTYKPNSWVELL